jgi:hypothetical protein
MRFWINALTDPCRFMKRQFVILHSETKDLVPICMIKNPETSPFGTNGLRLNEILGTQTQMENWPGIAKPHKICIENTKRKRDWCFCRTNSFENGYCSNLIPITNLFADFEFLLTVPANSALYLVKIEHTI